MPRYSPQTAPQSVYFLPSQNRRISMNRAEIPGSRRIARPSRDHSARNIAPFDLPRGISMARFGLRTNVALTVGLLSLLAAPNFVLAQTGGGGNTIGGGATAGVAVDADGVLSRVMKEDPTGDLSRQRIQEALTRLDRNVAHPSKLRKVSLTRLERVIKDHITKGQQIDDPLRHLAGLNRIQYVFCYPKSGDVVIAGPAEAWAEAPSGRILAVDSGRPVLDLDDLVVALRAFPPGKDNKKPFIYCSIDPTEDGLSRLHQFLHELGGRIGDPRKNPGQDQFIVNGLSERLGMQVITVGGVSPKTHFAQVMVEADYRMKLIGIGLENPPVHLTSYVDRA